MKAWLVLQEGPGEGRTYLLDPAKQPLQKVGRSSDCHLVLKDGRVSRHHADIRWDERQWTVVDRASTNGTYVNGMRVHGPYDLRIGDRLTLGETTMVLRKFDAQHPAPPVAPRPALDQPRPAREWERMGEVEAFQAPGPAVQRRQRVPSSRAARRPPASAESYRQTPAWVKAAFWFVQGIVAAAVVLLAGGAFLPWLRITGSLSPELGPVLQTLTDIASLVLGTDSYFQFTQDIWGLEGYGKLTLSIALISLCALVADIIFHRRSVVPGVVYLLSALIASGTIASDLVNLYRFYEQAKSISFLFGIRLEQVVEVFDHFVDMKIAPLTGLWLTILGLSLLLVGGAGRLVVALLSRSEGRSTP